MILTHLSLIFYEIDFAVIRLHLGDEEHSSFIVDR